MVPAASMVDPVSQAWCSNRSDQPCCSASRTRTAAIPSAASDRACSNDIDGTVEISAVPSISYNLPHGGGETAQEFRRQVRTRTPAPDPRGAQGSARALQVGDGAGLRQLQLLRHRLLAD